MSAPQERPVVRQPDVAATETPNSVIAAVVAGSVVVPFLIVLGTLFIAHGVFVNVDTPDVTSTRGGEAAVGVLIVVFLALVAVGLARLLGGRDRWVFLLGQLITVGVSFDFVIDRSSGDPYVPGVVLVASALAVAFAVVPTSWNWVKHKP